MAKYWHVINVGIQNTLVYRVNFFFRVIFGLVPLFAVISLWRAVYGSGSGAVGGYTLSQMISYYLILTIVDALTAVSEDDWQIAADIKDGNISQFLVKPIDYLTYRFCLFGAGRLIYTAVAALPVAAFIWMHRQHFILPADLFTFACFLVSLTLTGLLQFLLSYTLALMAFWLLEVSTLIFIVFAFEYIAGGHLFPVDILPAMLVKILFLTPFPYLLYFPVSIYVGKTTGNALWMGLAVQALWVTAGYLLARFAWSRGVRKYSAVGG